MLNWLYTNLGKVYELKERRQELRNNATVSEQKLWEKIHDKQISGVKFRRQHSIGKFITDFYAPEIKLVIEIDGDSHFTDEAIVYDKERTAFIESLRIKVIRFTNDEILKNIEGVVSSIQAFVDKQISKKENSNNTFAPIDILDYIYAVLHSPSYREKYKEFLKIDFPRVPYPKDASYFWKMVKIGTELRELHLLESNKVKKFITSYPRDGGNEVANVKYNDNKVWINDNQYFDKVPAVAWEFYIGGYQPAQKWLKDRKGRKLSFDDIEHYQKIIVALTETDRIMKEIDKVIKL